MNDCGEKKEHAWTKVEGQDISCPPSLDALRDRLYPSATFVSQILSAEPTPASELAAVRPRVIGMNFKSTLVIELAVRPRKIERPPARHRTCADLTFALQHTTPPNKSFSNDSDGSFPNCGFARRRESLQRTFPQDDDMLRQ